jgi:hypothetical protein
MQFQSARPLPAQPEEIFARSVVKPYKATLRIVPPAAKTWRVRQS